MAGSIETVTRQPRYRTLADTLIREIRSGRRAVGSNLPSELELMRSFGVSRHTVREALRRLEDIGLIERRRRLGTRVRSRKPVEAYSQTVRSLADLLQYPAQCRLVLLESGPVVVAAQLARVLGCEPGSEWYRLRALRRLGRRGPAICQVDIHVLPEFAALVSDLGRSRLRVFELIEQRFGRRVANVRVDIAARPLDGSVARALDVAAGSPSLTVVRRYYDDAGTLFETALSEHAADRYSYTLDLRREWLVHADV
jgi:GntR family transcriptional regulator